MRSGSRLRCALGQWWACTGHRRGDLSPAVGTCARLAPVLPCSSSERARVWRLFCHLGIEDKIEP